MSSTITGEFGELVIETQMIDVTSGLPKPDKNWRYTDRAGHEHRWQDDRGSYPTLVAVEEDRYWCDECSDEHVVEHLECRLCGEEIEPGMVGPSMFREMVAGRTSYRLNGQEIDEDEARRLYESTR